VIALQVIDKFIETVKKYPTKTAFYTDKESITFSALLDEAKRIGTYLINASIKKSDVVLIFMEKGLQTINSMLGIIYSGAIYVVLDETSPVERINKIIETVSPVAILYDDSLTPSSKEQLKSVSGISFINYQDMIKENIDDALLFKRQNSIISTDPLYILFTSGSTGIPKGTVVTHNNVLSYIEWVSTEFNFNENTNFANAAPFYFSMSVTDIYSTLFCGCSFYITPKTYFSFPVKLFEALDKYQINTIYWVPSAYQIIASFKMFDYMMLKHLKLCLFAGEVMPGKVLAYWQHALPNASFANLFGPTETTDICTFYKVDHTFSSSEVVPIGNACSNLDVFLLNDNLELASDGEIGELYCRGSFVASGYYNNLEKTNESFVQNPLNKSYPEIVYKTGDLCRYNELHELIYISRKDYQIKHLGYRIELGEIETAINANSLIDVGCMIYDDSNDLLVLIYTGKITADEIMKYLSEKLPFYMLPNRIIKERKIKYNANGKIDRAYYKLKIKETNY